MLYAYRCSVVYDAVLSRAFSRGGYVLCVLFLRVFITLITPFLNPPPVGFRGMAGCASPLAGLRAGPASLALLVLAVAWTAPFAADAFPAFRDEIPNGLRSVRASDPAHHFTGEQSYRALGHILAEGGGKLNVFGEAFRAAGFEWTTSSAARTQTATASRMVTAR